MGGRGEGKITITTIALTWRNTDTPHAFTIEGGLPYSKLSWQCTVDLWVFSWAVRLLVASLIYMRFTLAEGSLCEVCNNTYTVPRCWFLWLLSDNTLTIASGKVRFLSSRCQHSPPPFPITNTYIYLVLFVNLTEHMLPYMYQYVLQASYGTSNVNSENNWKGGTTTGQTPLNMRQTAITWEDSGLNSTKSVKAA